MIDTIKLGIPLKEQQLKKLLRRLTDDEQWQWVQFQNSTGELRLVRCRGLAQTDQHSFHRDIRWDIPASYIPEQTFLTLEFSIPKFWYGHNIHLLYGYVDALQQLKKLLEKQLNLRLPDVMQWKVSRVDCCYAWRTPTQQLAQQMLDALKCLHFPRKKPIIYPTSLVFSGATYTVKFYLKYPEFRQHDMKALINDKYSMEYVNHLEELSKGVIRYEATLRRQYLKKKEINTVADLVRLPFEFEFSPDFYELNNCTIKDSELLNFYILYILSVNDVENGGTFEKAFSFYLNGGLETLQHGEEFSSLPGTITVNDRDIDYNGGSFKVWRRDNPTSILQYFLQKFLGDNRTMQEADQVQAKLIEKYKSNKALKLMGIWLYVQKFGRAKAKEFLGKSAFYNAQREIREAGCSFVEPPLLYTVNEQFIKSFEFDIPSPYVTNTVDDYRDTGNIINLIPHIVEKKLFEGK
jgi:hypothetical protein